MTGGQAITMERYILVNCDASMRITRDHSIDSANSL
jgi:hypothetical protein